MGGRCCRKQRDSLCQRLIRNGSQLYGDFARLQTVFLYYTALLGFPQAWRAYRERCILYRARPSRRTSPSFSNPMAFQKARPGALRS